MHQPLRDLSPAVSSVCVRACENSVRIVHPNWFVLSSFHSLSHTQRASNDCKKKDPPKMFEFQISINSSLAWNKVSCVSICPLIGGLCVYLCCTMQHTLDGCRHQTAGCVQCVSVAPYSSMPQCAVIELRSAMGPARAEWVSSPIKSS